MFLGDESKIGRSVVESGRRLPSLGAIRDWPSAARSFKTKPQATARGSGMLILGQVLESEELEIGQLIVFFV